MRLHESPNRHRTTAGFTLPAILVVVSALLILAIGVLLIVSVERGTARSFTDRQRAELAARAGLEDFRGLLNLETCNDEFLIVQSTLATPIHSGRKSAPQLFIVRGKTEGSGYTYRYIPLFSARRFPPDLAHLAPQQIESLVDPGPNDSIDFTTLPYNDKVHTSWLTIYDDKNRSVARYAYWVEDLQSRIDPATAGNQRGDQKTHTRAVWPFPAPGLNPANEADDQTALDQINLDAVLPDPADNTPPTLEKTLVENRKLIISPDSILAAARIDPPLKRIKEPSNDQLGELADPKGRAVEEGFSAVLRPYLEQPLLPFADGINPAMAGKPKLNLNQLLETDRAQAVEEMANFIKNALPKFKNRCGGFPDDYLETLAANAMDYADADSDSTTAGRYRGIDNYPLVSEFLMRFRWEDVITEAGRKYVMLSASTYVELWNMSDKTVNGTAEVTFETAYHFQLGANPEVSLSDLTSATPTLAQSDGKRWFPPIEVSLKPNEYRVICGGTVNYKIDAGSSSSFVASPLLLEGETYGSSGTGYQLKWNGRLVDQSRGGVHRNNSSLHYPTDTLNSPRQRVRATIPSHSSTRNGAFVNNMGDPRMSYYLGAPQDANAYPDNYSPNRRNVRWGSIYSTDSATKTKVYGRVMPSEWPDGGHNSTYESNTFHTTDPRINPDDPRFFLTLPIPSPEEAPLRISNLGRFYSATELGRLYDPIMWQNSLPTGANLPWGDVETNSRPSSDYGGGNTLRIGRPEHPRFIANSETGMEAARLLDLFHAGRSRSNSPNEREGPVVQIQGHLNLNTANRDVLRAIIIGQLTMDPKMAIRTSENHDTHSLMAPPVKPFSLTAIEIRAEADRIADAIISAREITPFASTSSLAALRDSSGKLVFGNLKLIPNGSQVDRSDSAAEEIFARVYEATTVRSRNFRIWVVGQTLTPSTSSSPEVLAEVRKVFNVFADPGKRKPNGEIDPTKSRITILYENHF
jgi:type II secretory pathway pseudopilin PulG